MDRLALVIGNSKYQYVAELKNPCNDANDMATTLSSLGFKVLLYLDLDLAGFAEAVRKFLIELDEYSTGLFYFAGHGMQIDNKNLLVPVDCIVRDINTTIFSCFKLEDYLNGISRYKGKTNICILDACRDNPFALASRDITVGFAPVYAKPTGTIIAFSTSPDNSASDGNGTNGLYTSVLKELIKIPNIKIEETFKAVRVRVMNLSGDSQTSWEHSCLVGDFYFSVVREPVITSISDEAIYSYIRERGDYYETVTKDIYDIECMPFVDAYYKYGIPILKILRAYSRVENIKIGKAFSDKEIDAINIGYVESWGYKRVNGRWYFKGKYVEMGDPLPLPDDMLPLKPNEGQELDISSDLVCEINDGKVYLKLTSNLPDETPLMFCLKGKNYWAQSNAIVSSKSALSEGFSDHNNPLNNGLYTVEISCPINNVLPDTIKPVFGERNRNLIGKHVAFDPIGGNILSMRYHLLIKNGEVTVA